MGHRSEPMAEVNVAVTATIRSAAARLLDSETRVDKSLRDVLAGCQGEAEEATTIPFSRLRQLREALCASGETLRLYELMAGSEIVEEPLHVPPPHPDLVKRRVQLKVKLDELEYARMVRDVSQTRRDEKPLDVVGLRKAGSLVANLLLTLVACFMFGFFVTASFLPLPMRVLFGVMCALVAGGAELYFLLRTSL